MQHKYVLTFIIYLGWIVFENKRTSCHYVSLCFAIYNESHAIEINHLYPFLNNPSDAILLARAKGNYVNPLLQFRPKLTVLVKTYK